MNGARALLAQRRQRRGQRRRILCRRQRLHAGHRAERLALLVFERGRLGDGDQAFGQHDLAVERRGADGRADDVGRQRAPRRFGSQPRTSMRAALAAFAYRVAPNRSKV